MCRWLSLAWHRKRKSDAFVYQMDLFPTFAEFAGAKIPDGVEGKSMVPILNGQQTKVRDVLYTGYRDLHAGRSQRSWKLIRYPLVDRTQLFDLSNDPRELVQPCRRSQAGYQVAEIDCLVVKEMDSYGDKVPLTVANPRPPNGRAGSSRQVTQEGHVESKGWRMK